MEPAVPQTLTNSFFLFIFMVVKFLRQRNSNKALCRIVPENINHFISIINYTEFVGL